MEWPRFLWMKLFWIAVHLSTLARAESFTTTDQPQEASQDSPASGYEWSSWSSWTPCSKTCGGGVSMQERQCLPRSRSIVGDDTLPRPVITVRVTREVTTEPCQGEAKRYHECNTAPCEGVTRDPRTDQCASYDRRPFRGRFYTWVPYVDGNSPCILNCRPLGQHFYASLALVADGTPCTKPGTRAICVQGTCKVETQIKWWPLWTGRPPTRWKFTTLLRWQKTTGCGKYWPRAIGK